MKEKGAGGDVDGVDPLITPIPRSLQSDPSEPAWSETRTPGRLDRHRLERFIRAEVMEAGRSLTLAVAGVGGVVEEVGVAVAAAAAVGEVVYLLTGAAVAAVLHQARVEDGEVGKPRRRRRWRRRGSRRRGRPVAAVGGGACKRRDKESKLAATPLLVDFTFLTA